MRLSDHPTYEPLKAETKKQAEKTALSRARCLVIVPAKNESASIGALIRRLSQHCPDADILVIDDGSIDGTAGHVPPNAFVVTLPFNLGIGGAMQTGYRFAHLHGYDMAVQVDGDGQHRPLEIQKLIDVMTQEKADMVIGTRFAPDNPSYRQTIGRWIGGRFLNKLIQTLSGLKLTDCTSGFRIVNKRVIRAFAHWYPEDYPEPEVALLLARSGCTVKETPVRMRQRVTGTSSISMLLGGYYLVKVGFCLLLDTCRNPWPENILEPASPTKSKQKQGKEPARATVPTTEIRFLKEL